MSSERRPRKGVAEYATREDGLEPGPLARGVSAFGHELLTNPKLLAES